MGSAKGGGIVPMDPIARLQELMEAAALPSTSLELKRNEFLKTSGSIDTRLYYIDSGSLRIFFEDEFEEHTSIPYVWVTLETSLPHLTRLYLRSHPIYTFKP